MGCCDAASVADGPVRAASGLRRVSVRYLRFQGVRIRVGPAVDPAAHADPVAHAGPVGPVEEAVSAGKALNRGIKPAAQPSTTCKLCW